MATVTPNLGLQRPAVGADADQWGDLLNQTIDTLDAKVFDKTNGGSISKSISIPGPGSTFNPAAYVVQLGLTSYVLGTAAGPDAEFGSAVYLDGAGQYRYTLAGVAAGRVSLSGGALTYSYAQANVAGAIATFTSRFTVSANGNSRFSPNGSFDTDLGAHQFNSANGVVHQVVGQASSGGSSVSSTKIVNSNAYTYLQQGLNGGVATYQVLANGNVQNTNNSYGALSDIKLKENIVDATPKLAALNQLRVVNYNLKGESLKQIGLIAQEVEIIFPGLVESTPDYDEIGALTGTQTKSIKYSVLVPMLLKAVQELSSEVNALKAANAAA